MRTRTKLAALGVVAVLAAGVGTYAFSATAGGFGPMHGMMESAMGPGMMMGGQGMTGERHGPFGAAMNPSSHLDALKTELAITSEQEAAWTSYVKTVGETATAMRTAAEGASGGDRQAFFATMQAQMQTSFDTVKAAADQLLASLDETQKAKAGQILPGLAAGPAVMGAGMGMGGHHAMRHGFGN